MVDVVNPVCHASYVSLMWRTSQHSTNHSHCMLGNLVTMFCSNPLKFDNYYVLSCKGHSMNKDVNFTSLLTNKEVKRIPYCHIK